MNNNKIYFLKEINILLFEFLIIVNIEYNNKNHNQRFLELNIIVQQNIIN